VTDLRLENFSVGYGNKLVINNISTDFKGGEMTAIVGRNGIGKTTLMKAIAGMTKSEGKVYISGEKDNEIRKEIAYVPQLGDLNTRLTVFEMVLLGLVNNLKWHVSDEQIERVYKTLKDMRIHGISDQPFNTLSGGQKQMVSMAQSLISKPKVLLLDEPTSALDIRHQLIVMNLAQKYTRETGAATIFIVHDLMGYANSVAWGTPFMASARACARHCSPSPEKPAFACHRQKGRGGLEAAATEAGMDRPPVGTPFMASARA